MIGFTDERPPASEASIRALEAALGHELPPAYRRFLLSRDGGDPEPNVLLDPDGQPTDVGVRSFLSVTPGWGEMGLAEAREDLLGEIGQGWLPVANIEGGAYLLLGIAAPAHGLAVVDIAHLEGPDLVATDFDDFLGRLVDLGPYMPNIDLSEVEVWDGPSAVHHGPLETPLGGCSVELRSAGDSVLSTADAGSLLNPGRGWITRCASDELAAVFLVVPLPEQWCPAGRCTTWGMLWRAQARTRIDRLELRVAFYPSPNVTGGPAPDQGLAAQSFTNGEWSMTVGLDDLEQIVHARGGPSRWAGLDLVAWLPSYPGHAISVPLPDLEAGETAEGTGGVSWVRGPDHEDLTWESVLVSPATILEASGISPDGLPPEDPSRGSPGT